MYLINLFKVEMEKERKGTPKPHSSYKLASEMSMLFSKIIIHKQAIECSFLFILFLTNMMLGTCGNNSTDRLSLLAIKSRITYDPQGVTSSWNDSLHFCQWRGITCGRRHKRVVFLDMRSKGLGGSLSPHVGNLSFLRGIWLSNNTLGGGIPPEITRLHRLQLLTLGNNSFVGEIPANFSHCPRLQYLDFSGNKLGGRIPEDIGLLPVIYALGIYDNPYITGGIPTFIGNLTTLEILELSGCPFGGRIPDVFHRLSRLKQLGFTGSQLVGTIPPSVYNLSVLEVLDFSNNRVRGDLPASFGSAFPRLQNLILSRNFMTGSLPPSISNCSQISLISMGSNDFTGKIGIHFGGLQNLRKVYLAVNRLGEGENDSIRILDSLSNCSNLEQLELGENRLQGVLPNSLGNFSTKLSYLSLQQNYVYGGIPPSIGNLLGLNLLSLGFNQLTGTIPTSIGNLGNLQEVLLQVNNLSGEIPDTIGNLSSLLRLSMAVNALQGLLPPSLGRCQKLIALSVQRNNLSGSIPRQLFQLSSLTIFLSLSQNHFSGPVSPEIGNLSKLNYLDLSRNNLSGELPSTLSSCTQLVSLFLSSNSFQGPIPPSLGSLRGLQILDLSSNIFSGHIPAFLEYVPLQYLNLSFNSFDGEVPVKGVFANESAISVEGNERLCGGIRQLQLPKCTSKHSINGRHKLSSALIISISTLAGVTVVSLVLIYWCVKKRKAQTPGWSSKEPFLKVSYERLLKATDGFSSENLVGTGAFSSVYKGILDEVGLTVAVKVLNLQHRGGSKSFVAECEALRNVRHRNLVKVITSCSSIDFQGNDFRAIVYEFMPNGSLERWLNPSTRTINEQEELHELDLLQRISIAIDVAYAIDYLHNHCGMTIVHCDLKPSNILLDKDMVAHVGDFGLAKLLLPDQLRNPSESSSIGVRGTVGYAAPEYGLGSDVSTSGDVYSYGILLLEMVIRKKPTDPIFHDGLNLHKYADGAVADDCVLDVVDPILLQGDGDGDGEDEEVTVPPTPGSHHGTEQSNYINVKDYLTLLINIGVACSKEAPHDRMDIDQVINELSLIRSTIMKSYQSGGPNASRAT